MGLEDRDFAFTDEQVKALGFTSYEDLEKYYDILYDFMDKPYDKSTCIEQLKQMESDIRLDDSREEKYTKSMHDIIGVMEDMAKNGPVNDDDFIRLSQALNKRLEVFNRIINKKFSIKTDTSLAHKWFYHLLKIFDWL